MPAGAAPVIPVDGSSRQFGEAGVRVMYQYMYLLLSNMYDSRLFAVFFFGLNLCVDFQKIHIRTHLFLFYFLSLSFSLLLSWRQFIRSFSLCIRETTVEKG
jgi:hypothetical protein